MKKNLAALIRTAGDRLNKEMAAQVQLHLDHGVQFGKLVARALFKHFLGQLPKWQVSPGGVAQWSPRPPTEQKIPGSNPSRVYVFRNLNTAVLLP
jgi:hypothetical protein